MAMSMAHRVVFPRHVRPWLAALVLVASCTSRVRPTEHGAASFPVHIDRKLVQPNQAGFRPVCSYAPEESERITQALARVEDRVLKQIVHLHCPHSDQAVVDHPFLYAGDGHQNEIRLALHVTCYGQRIPTDAQDRSDYEVNVDFGARLHGWVYASQGDRWAISNVALFEITEATTVFSRFLRSAHTPGDPRASASEYPYRNEADVLSCCGTITSPEMRCPVTPLPSGLQ